MTHDAPFDQHKRTGPYAVRQPQRADVATATLCRAFGVKQDLPGDWAALLKRI